MPDLITFLGISTASASVAVVVFQMVINHMEYNKMVGELRCFSEKCSKVSFTFLTKHYYNPTAIERTVDNWHLCTYRLDRRMDVDIYK